MAFGPSVVWMVHKGVGPRGIRGELILEAERLIFRPELRAARPDTLGETVVGLDQVRKVTRARRSPVLELHVQTEGLPPVVLFYFVKPPDIYSSGAANPRSYAAVYLTNAAAVYEEEVAHWLSAIKERIPT
jgi:hypothetical protein